MSDTGNEASADAGQLRATALWVALTVLVFSPSLSAGFVWDDTLLIVRDTRIHTLPDLGALMRMQFFPPEEGEVTVSYFRPLLKLVHALGYQAFGAQPFGYHVVNIALHALNVALGLLWIRRRIGATGAPGESGESGEPGEPGERGAAVWAAALAMIVFALHPTRPLTVTWISGGGDALYCTFVLSALLLWQRRTLSAAAAAGLVALSAAATLSKESGVTLVAILLLDGLLLMPRERLRVRLPALGAMAVVQGALLTWRASVLPPMPWGPLREGVFGLCSRVAVSLGYELRALVWPSPIRHQIRNHLGQPTALPTDLQLLGVLGLVVGLAFVVAAARAIRRLEYRPWVADAAVFLLLLLPGLNVVEIGVRGGTLAERYLYAPALAIACLVARGLLRLQRNRPRRALSIVGAGWGALYVVMALLEMSYLQSPQTLYAHFARQEPRQPFGVESLLEHALVHGDMPTARSCNDQRLCILADLWSGGTSGTGAPPAAGLLAFVDVELTVVSDADSERLAELGAVLDAILEGGEVRLEVQGRRVVTTLARGDRLSAEQRARTRLLRAMVDARLGRFVRATAALRTLQAGGADAVVPRWLALSALAGGDVDTARQALSAMRAAPPQSTAPLRQVVALLEIPEAERAPHHVLAVAVTLADAGLPAAARIQVDAIAGLDADERRLALAAIDLADRRPDLAAARLSQLAARAGALAPEQRRRLGQLAARARQVRAPRPATSHRPALAHGCVPCAELPPP